MKTIRHALLGAIVLVLTWVAAPNAHAYPHFQFSSDTDSCSTCHYAPAGGGLINGWGRDTMYCPDRPSAKPKPPVVPSILRIKPAVRFISFMPLVKRPLQG